MTLTGLATTVQWPGMTSHHWVAAAAIDVTTTRPFQVGGALTGHRGLVFESAGRVRRVDAPPMAVYVTAHEPITWWEVNGPAEALEIYPDFAALERDVARPLELLAASVVADATVFAIAIRLRAAHVGTSPLTDVEASTLAVALGQHVSQRYGRGSVTRGPGSLGAAQVDKVADYVRANLGQALRLQDLADLVFLSPFHFARAFKASTGLAPHAFVTAQRLTVARDLLVGRRQSVADVAYTVGFSNVGHFRRLFHRHHGLLPGVVGQ